ncbi:hypothetical protein AAG570_003079 [Ranatra chinensis]|uniref:Uncharacterized protein n=1 Tax=Ranatra chinensis TaxID=642074 RepID=A0ABD0YK12_9HEMI
MGNSGRLAVNFEIEAQSGIPYLKRIPIHYHSALQYPIIAQFSKRCCLDTSVNPPTGWPVRNGRLASRVRSVPYPAPVYTEECRCRPPAAAAAQPPTAGEDHQHQLHQHHHQHHYTGGTSLHHHTIHHQPQVATTCELAPQPTLAAPQQGPMLFVPFSVPHLSIAANPSVSPSATTTPIIKVWHILKQIYISGIQLPDAPPIGSLPL